MSRGTAGTVALVAVVPLLAAFAAFVTLTTTDAPSASLPAGSGGATGHAVVIRNFAYAPAQLVVTAGTTVDVANTDGTRHTLTADDHSFDTGNLDGGARAQVVLDRPGRYAYHCAIHDYMKGTIEVRG